MRHNVQKKEVAALSTKLPEKCMEPLRALTDDRRLLVTSHIPLAYAMAWRMRDCGVSLEDLRQEGCLGLCEAALRYDENVGCSFAAYASHWCRKKILLAIDSGRRSAECRQETLLHDREADDNLLRGAQRHRVEDALQCLAREEQTVIRLYYGLGGERLSITEIASHLGIGKSRASVLHCRALKKLEAALVRRPLVDYLATWLG